MTGTLFEDTCSSGGESAALHTATIADGQSLSGAVQTDGLALVAVIVPSNWTAANMTFRASFDGITFYDLEDELGIEFRVPGAVTGAGKWLSVPTRARGARYLEVRSGVSSSPVLQADDVDIGLVLV